jgi:hypothetical protein
MKKIFIFLTAAVLMVSIWMISSILLAHNKNHAPSSLTTIPVTEVPSVKENSEDNQQENHETSNHPMLLATTSTMKMGQGSLGFNYKALSNKSETVRIFVKNLSEHKINYKLIAPSGTNWGLRTVEQGNSITTDHIFSEAEAGDWEISFNNQDGSEITVEVAVNDVL